VPAHHSEDSEIILQIAAMMKQPPFYLDTVLTPTRFLALTAHADTVFSMRLHGLICAMAAGTPMLALSYNPKVDAFMQQIKMERYCLPLDGFDSKTAFRLLQNLDALTGECLQEMNTQRTHLQTLAMEPAKIALELAVCDA